MYKIIVFILAFVLFLFEVSLYLFFGKSLDANILILTCIMILPGLFTLFERDSRAYSTLRRGRISEKILSRKLLTFFLEKLAFYALFIAGVSTVYLGLFFLIGNMDMFSLTLTVALLSLITGILTTLTESILTNS